jgi:hypothetical protein
MIRLAQRDDKIATQDGLLWWANEGLETDSGVLPGVLDQGSAWRWGRSDIHHLQLRFAGDEGTLQRA